MIEVASVVPGIRRRRRKTRAETALDARSAPEDFDLAAARSTFAKMVAEDAPLTQRMTGS